MASPTPVLGDSVNYLTPVFLGSTPQAALVIALNADDNTADLRVFNGFAQGTTDVQHVPQADGPTAGSFWYARTVNPPAETAKASTVPAHEVQHGDQPKSHEEKSKLGKLGEILHPQHHGGESH